MHTYPFQRVLVANRGEVAVRLITAVQSLGLHAVSVYISEDSASRHVSLADVSISLGADAAAYNSPQALLAAALATGAQAVLPGYGFVSENPHAARLFQSNAICWIGPRPETIDLFGLKHTAKVAALDAKVPTIPGSPLVHSVDHALQHACQIGYPTLLKASAGGGGMGQAVVQDDAALRAAFPAVVEQCTALFSSSDIYVEKYLHTARHIEVQVFGDGQGTVVALGDRDCSVQRRRQKVIEEGNAPNIPTQLRSQLRQAAIRLCAAHNYRSAGTVEFIMDANTHEWYFLEVNTRLQVEHGVTELVSGIDIVQWMIQLAAGIDVLKSGHTEWKERGVAIEARVYAENPNNHYAPCPGTLSDMVWPEQITDPETGSRVRVDSWAETGSTVSSHYDPLLGKVLVWGRTRALAILQLKDALQKTKVRGVPSNVELLLQVVGHPKFLQGQYTTALLNTFSPKTASVQVVKPGLQSSLQDYPGRVGYWHVGVSPSGPMDAYAMGMANALVGNTLHACALEMTVSGPSLIFHTDSVIALAGGYLNAELDDGKPVPWWTPFTIKAGTSLSIGGAVEEDDDQAAHTGGKVAYLAIRGGFDAPKYLGSASTFPNGKFGGITGSFLAAGDFLPIGKDIHSSLLHAEINGLSFRWPLNKQLPSAFIPSYDVDEWTVAALNGPHASNDFLEDDTLKAIWSTPYEVHHATNRLGARLIGPVPKWTRSDGGSAGLHPSNLHDYTYAPGAVNFSGNTPIILMLDGPSLGGFVCPITVATADLWKVAQARPGEKVRFQQVDFDQASKAVFSMEDAWDAIRMNDTIRLQDIETTWSPWWVQKCSPVDVPAVLASLDPSKGDTAEIKVSYRISGDEHVLIEYGNIELDLAYRMRVHILMEELSSRDFVKELCPGVRSLLLRYDRKKVHLNTLVSTLKDLEMGVLSSVEHVTVPSRVIELPLAFEDKWTVEAQGRYLRSVRPDAPYMPSNVEFVRRINGLSSTEDVKDIMTTAEYMVLGLGDVYLGAPCAVPVDPRHRLVTSKYNPARTYTPEGAVGIGGAYMCIYGMDSPGGYQLTGRTLPIWDNYGSVPEENRGATKEIPWLLRFFDRVKFFPVSDDELEEMRSSYRRGDYKIKITDEEFSYRDYVDFCESEKESIAQFEQQRETAFQAERVRWEAEGEGASNAAAAHASRKNGQNGQSAFYDAEETTNAKRHSHSISVLAEVAASVWTVHVTEGQYVDTGQQLFTLESMKVEISVEAPLSGTIQQITVTKGDTVSPDRELCVIVANEDIATEDAQILRLKDMYKLGVIKPGELVRSILSMTESNRNIFSSVMKRESCDVRIAELLKAKSRKAYLPLFGIPFVVSDDIAVKDLCSNLGLSTSQAVSKSSSAVVTALEEAGAILIGKTCVDELNIGYTGVESSSRSPENPIAPGLITGGNGAAAIAVKKQLASFAITVDRNGTSTMAPALCGVTGLKTTEGLIPVSDSVISCPSADCISIYANNVPDLKRVLEVCLATRTKSQLLDIRPNPKATIPAKDEYDSIVIGVQTRDAILSQGMNSDNEIIAYREAVERLEDSGCSLHVMDMKTFSTASGLFEGLPVDYALRNSVEEIVQKSPSLLSARVLEQIGRIDGYSASALGVALSRMKLCKRAAEGDIWSKVDAVVLPAMGEAVSVESAKADIIACNNNLAQFSQFLTAMDLCAITLHTGASGGKGPSGIMLVAPAFQEELILEVAAKW